MIGGGRYWYGNGVIIVNTMSKCKEFLEVSVVLCVVSCDDERSVRFVISCCVKFDFILVLLPVPGTTIKYASFQLPVNHETLCFHRQIAYKITSLNGPYSLL